MKKSISARIVNKLREFLLLASLPLILLATLYITVALFWVTLAVCGIAIHASGALVLPAIYTFVPTFLWTDLALPLPASLPPGTVQLLPLDHLSISALRDFARIAAERAVMVCWPYALGLAALWLVFGYRYQQKWGAIAAEMNRLPAGSAPDIEYDLAELAAHARLKLPALSIWRNDAPNAFASGLNEETYTITITTGMLSRLSRAELKAVMAHELGHIAHGDVRLLTLCFIYGGFFGSAASWLWRNVYDSLSGAQTRYNRLFFTIPFVALVACVFSLAAGLAALVRTAMLRERELHADAFAARLLLHDCELAGALSKIAAYEAPVPPVRMLRETVIHRPIKGWRDKLMATHPPIAKRQAALQQETSVAPPVKA